MASEPVLDIPNFKLAKSGANPHKIPFLPKKGPNGEYTARSVLRSGLGQLMFIGAFMAFGFSYGQMSEGNSKRYKAQAKAREEAARRMAAEIRDRAELAAKAKNKPKYRYEGDLSSLPTDEGRVSFKKLVRGKLYSEDEPKPHAEAPAQQAQPEVAAAPEPQPQLPAAPAAVAAAPRPSARQPWRPGKRLSRAGGLSGGIYGSFKETKTAEAGGAGAAGARSRSMSSGRSQPRAGAPAAAAGTAAMPAGMPGMPPGMDMNALMKQAQGGQLSPEMMKSLPPGALKAASGAGAASPSAGRLAAGGARGLGEGARPGGAPARQFRGGAPGADAGQQAQGAASAAKLDKTSEKLAKLGASLERGAGDEGTSQAAGKLFEKGFGQGTVDGPAEDGTLKASARPAAEAAAAAAASSDEASASEDEGPGVVADQSQPIMAEEAGEPERAAPAAGPAVAGPEPRHPSRSWTRASAALAGGWGALLILQIALNMLFAAPLSSGVLAVKQLLQGALIALGYGLAASGSVLMGLGSAAPGVLFSGLGAAAVLGGSAAYPAVAGAGRACAAVSRSILSSIIPVFGKKDDKEEPKARKVLIPVA